MEHLDTFLALYPPFDALGAAELRALASTAREHSYAAGEAILVEDGLPASSLHVITGGSAVVLHEGIEIQVLGAGECFGHPSLLTGLAPAFTVRAREDTRCVLFDRHEALGVLGTAAGAAHVARTLRARLVGAGHTVHGLREVGTTPVSAIMRPATYCDPALPARDAAAQLGQPGVSELLVALPDGTLGVVTDAEIRASLAGGAHVLDAPVAHLARAPVPTAPVGQLAIEATIDMLAADCEHLAVLDGQRVCGVLSARDLLGLDANSPIALRHTILRAADEEVLVRASSHLPQLFVTLASAGVLPRDLGRVLSLHQDALVQRLIDFSIARHGSPPLPWAWLDLGSAARREFTLASDQDNALAYGTPAETEREAVEGYFLRLAVEVNAGLLRCGLSADNNGVLAQNALWRMSKTDWLKTFDDCMRTPDESHLMRAMVAFDFRTACGPLGITAELTERIRAAREHPLFMRPIARSGSDHLVSLNLRGQLATGKHGEAADRIDIKRGAIIPLVNLVRFKALAHGVTISPTLDRIEAVASAGGFQREHADALTEAFGVICRIRVEHHVAQIAAGQAVDNLIDPAALAPIARTELRGALQTVRRAQRAIRDWTPPVGDFRQPSM
jgi:CBS domain-containing protein